jgi:diaminopimelate epimerase
MLGICGSRLSFRTLAGIVRAEVMGSQVKLQMTSPSDLRLDEKLELSDGSVVAQHINTGVPHTVFILDTAEDLEKQDIVSRGREVRYHSHYAPAGTNVNFITVLGQRSLEIRTYERGVEDETLACGTGATAVALVAAAKGLVEPPVDVRTRSGETLTIYFSGETPEEVYMEGAATVVYQGQLWQEAVDNPGR